MKYIEEQLQSLPHLNNKELIDSFRQLHYGISLIKRNGSADDIGELEGALEAIRQELQRRSLESALKQGRRGETL